MSVSVGDLSDDPFEIEMTDERGLFAQINDDSQPVMPEPSLETGIGSEPLLPYQACAQVPPTLEESLIDYFLKIRSVTIEKP